MDVLKVFLEKTLEFVNRLGFWSVLFAVTVPQVSNVVEFLINYISGAHALYVFDGVGLFFKKAALCAVFFTPVLIVLIFVLRKLRVAVADDVLYWVGMAGVFSFPAVLVYDHSPSGELFSLSFRLFYFSLLSILFFGFALCVVTILRKLRLID